MSLCMGCMQEKGEADICPHCGYAAEAEAENAAYLPPGTVLQGRYLLGKVLGQGGFGITYIGYDQTLHTRVAIKEYYPGDIAQRTPGDRTVMPYTQAENDYEHGRERFLEEARTLARFSEFPGIVSVKDCFADGNTAYMVMQFLEGINLKEYLSRKGGKVSPEEAVSILTPVMDALKEVHRAGIIHRDISPDNIFITSEGQVKLIDFGAARQSLGGGKSLSVQLKPGYAPEEQYRTHGNQGTWTDVYALAATLYRMVTGQVPPEAMERLSYDTLEIPAGLPENIRIALQMGLAVRAPERYATIEQFQNALSGTVQAAASENFGQNFAANTHSGAAYDRLEQQMPYSNMPAAEKGNKKLILLLAAAGIALVCVLTIAVVFLFTTRSAPASVAVNGGTISGGSVPLQAAPTPAPTPVPYVPPVFTEVSASGTTAGTSGTRNYECRLVLDGRPDTAWNVPGGPGEWLVLSAQTPQQIKGLRVLNGYTKYSPDYNMWIYYANSRPKDVTLTFSDGSTLAYTFADTFDNDNYIYQTIDFGEIKTVTWIRITVNSIYPGSKWNDMCISEIQPY